LPRGRRHWETLLAPVKDDGGQVVKVLGSVRDVTEQKQTEAQLHRAQKLEAVGQLTGGVAHDFNNLLTTIIGNLDRIRTRGEGDPRLMGMAESALRAAERGARLTSQLLSFARRQTLRAEPVSVADLIGETSTLLRRAAGEAINVNIVLAPDLWPCCLDAAQFEAALLNLVLNARDAMPTGGGLKIAAHNLECSCEELRRFDLPAGNRAYVKVSVADTGTGMDDATLAKAFEPFFTTKAIGKGSGLGLSMVQGFVAQSGGTVAIDSARGRGTAVSLLLPRAAAGAAPAEAAKRSDRGAIPPLLLGRTVLVLEDEVDLLTVVHETLEEAGCRVFTARDGAQALAILAEDAGAAIELLFADVVLPNGKNGVEVAQAARRLRPSLKVLLTSGYAEEVLSRSGANIADLLVKPYTPRELVEWIAGALSGAIRRRTTSVDIEGRRPLLAEAAQP
jgi:signal transduction histidine kinase/CheY-like chemotaxis protein